MLAQGQHSTACAHGEHAQTLTTYAPADRAGRGERRRATLGPGLIPLARRGMPARGPRLTDVDKRVASENFETFRFT